MKTRDIATYRAALVAVGATTVAGYAHISGTPDIFQITACSLVLAVIVLYIHTTSSMCRCEFTKPILEVAVLLRTVQDVLWKSLGHCRMSCGSPWDIAGCLVEVLGTLQDVLWQSLGHGRMSCGSPWDIAGCLVAVILGTLQDVLWKSLRHGRMSCGSPWDIAACLVAVLGTLQDVLWKSLGHCRMSCGSPPWDIAGCLVESLRHCRMSCGSHPGDITGCLVVVLLGTLQDVLW